MSKRKLAPYEERLLVEAAAQGYRVGRSIARNSLRVGDVVRLDNTHVGYGGVSGNPITRLGPKNVVVTAPEYEMWSGEMHGPTDYRVPRYHVTHVLRGKTLHRVSS